MVLMLHRYPAINAVQALFCSSCRPSLPECSGCLMPYCEGTGDNPDTDCLSKCKGKPDCPEVSTQKRTDAHVCPAFIKCSPQSVPDASSVVEEVPMTLMFVLCLGAPPWYFLFFVKRYASLRLKGWGRKALSFPCESCRMLTLPPPSIGWEFKAYLSGLFVKGIQENRPIVPVAKKGTASVSHPPLFMFSGSRARACV